VPAQAGAGAQNAQWSGTPGGRARQQHSLQQAAIWSVIVLAIVVLGYLTLRVARGA